MIPYFNLAPIRARLASKPSSKRKNIDLQNLRATAAVRQMSQLSTTKVSTPKVGVDTVYHPYQLFAVGSPKPSFPLRYQDINITGRTEQIPGFVPLMFPDGQYKNAIGDLFLYHLGNSVRPTDSEEIYRIGWKEKSEKSDLILQLLKQNKDWFSRLKDADFDVELEYSEYWALSYFSPCFSLERSSQAKPRLDQIGCLHLETTVEDSVFSIYEHKYSDEVIYTWSNCSFLEDPVNSSILVYMGPIDASVLEHDYEEIDTDKKNKKTEWVTIKAFIPDPAVEGRFDDPILGDGKINYYDDFELYLEWGEEPLVQGYLADMSQAMIKNLKDGEISEWFEIWKDEGTSQRKSVFSFAELDFWNWPVPPIVHNPTGLLKSIMDLLVSLNFYRVT